MTKDAPAPRRGRAMQAHNAGKPLWTCPKCGARFVTKNMWHSCGVFTIDALFAKCAENVREAFAALSGAVTAAASDAVIIPQKTRAVFQLRTRFISVYPRKGHLLVGFVLTERMSNPRFVKIEGPITNAFVHYARLAEATEVDQEIESWIKASLPYGRQARPLRRR